MRFLRSVSVVSFVFLVCSAHIGSPDTWYEGTAGPYRIIVNIVAPGVVPGIAKVFVRVAEGDGARVTIQANRFDAIGAVPPPERAEPVEGDKQLFSGELWIMSRGSNSVTVDVSGPRGSGKAVVPVGVVAVRRLELNPRFGATLAVVGVFLFVGLVSIVGAAVRESLLPPGEKPDAQNRRKARVAMAASAAIAALALFGGSRWWDAEDRGYENRLYKPLASIASVRGTRDRPELDLRISDSTWLMRNDTSWLTKHAANRRTPLIEDHGKLAHVFMVREPDMEAFAHLHPVTDDSISFRSAIPPLPAGTYRVYADIVHESGFSETLPSKVTLGRGMNTEGELTDQDDASSYVKGLVNDSIATADSDVVIKRIRTASDFVAGAEAPLSFAITDKAGHPVALEPYMGMAGHAVINRDDGSVFVHLHPSGTYSMASQMAVTMRTAADSVSGRLGQRIATSSMLNAAMPRDGVVSFPYAFPQPGRYHMWVQVRHAGRILTGVFALNVKPASRQ